MTHSLKGTSKILVYATNPIKVKFKDLYDGEVKSITTSMTFEELVDGAVNGDFCERFPPDLVKVCNHQTLFPEELQSRSEDEYNPIIHGRAGRG